MAQTKPKKNTAKNGSPVKRKSPERRCVGCVGTFDKRTLLRVLRSPADENGNSTVSLDFTGKKSGRGAYVCKNPACLKKARKSGALARSLGCEITDDIYTELEREIAEALRLGEISGSGAADGGKNRADVSGEAE